jgi:hypothetical protein
MEAYEEILLALGELKGELVEIRKLSQRVSAIEHWQSWLKGAWAILAAGYAFLFRGVYAK